MFVDTQSSAGRRRLSRPAGAALLAAASLVAACAGRDPPTPRATIDPLARVTRVQWLDGQGPWPGENWWRKLADPRLDRLIEATLQIDPTLRAAEARLRAADAVERAARGRNDPTLAVAGELAEQRLSRTYLVPPQFAGRPLTTARAALEFGWEADFWGRNDAMLRAAIGQSGAARAERAQTHLLLSSAIAATWVSLVADHARLQRTQATLDLRSGLRQLVGRRVVAGLDDARERDLATALADEAVLAHERVRQRIAIGRNQLAALASLAHAPDPSGDDDARLATWAGQADAAVPAELPLQLVARRPDLAAQLARIATAAGQVDVAQAEFYPSINLAAFAGLQSVGLNQLLSRDSLIASAGPMVRLPILDGGRLRTQLALREADYDATVEQYNATLLVAVREVADQLAALTAQRDQLAVRERELAKRLQLEAAAERRRRSGLDTRLPSDERRLQRLASELARIDLQEGLALARIGLARALGGGFDEAAAGAARR